MVDYVRDYDCEEALYSEYGSFQHFALLGLMLMCIHDAFKCPLWLLLLVLFIILFKENKYGQCSF